jgi:hypothetical protein
MRFFLLTIIVFYASGAKGQHDSTNIYYQAILHYNAYLDELNSDDKEIFIEKNEEFTNSLPYTIGTRKITLLTVDNSKEHHRKNQNMIKYIKIYQGKIQGDKLEIRLMPHYSEYQGKKKRFTISVSDHLTIQFLFDCNEHRFKYTSTSGRMPIDLYKK